MVRTLIFLLALPAIASEEKSGQVVAMNFHTGGSVRAGELFTVGATSVRLVDKKNMKVELAPHSVVQFNNESELSVLRGSALLESVNERSLSTASARLDFRGRVFISYDHKERSTSAFVVEGEARLVNPQEKNRSLRLERLHGATMEIGSILPQLVRQLDYASVQSWLKGYAWPEARVKETLGNFTESVVAEKEEAPEYLRNVKLEEYFSAVEDADDSGQPDYYQKKFSDPDVVMAEAKSTKETNKSLSPEEAALIALPSTKIDLGFDVIGPEEKLRELGALDSAHTEKKGRELASVKPAKTVKAETKAPVSPAGDPDINGVLERLRDIKPKNPVISHVPTVSSSRAPASLATPVVPDPVYDYSQNF